MLKKIFLFFLFSLLLLIPNHKIYALEPFTKNVENPLLTNAFQPSLMHELGVYKMWYTNVSDSGLKIAQVNSDDGINWAAPTLLNFNDQDNHDPSILKDSQKYILFFASSSFGSNYKISKIESSDGVNFDQNTLKDILIPSENWELQGISAPFGFKKDATYYLFYSGWDGGSWKLGLATSTDGKNWIKCSNNPILSWGDGPHLLEKGNKYYLFYHMSDKSGIQVVESFDPLSCSTNWSTPNLVLERESDYDQNHIASPSIVDEGNKLLLYYSGLSSSNIWGVNLATSEETPEEKNFIIIIPGFMASWNKEAILHNQSVSLFDWSLLPFVKEYEGLRETLKNLGYVENQDFVIYPYDWRKDLNSQAVDLNTFLSQRVWNTNPNRRIDIIGHSLGGLIGRIFTQNNPKKINKIIAVGAPHKGTAHVYKPLEGGEIDKESNLLWLSEKIILTLNKNLFETDQFTINNTLPILKDLLPTYNFLIDNNGTPIDINSMQLKNNTLPYYNDGFPLIFNYFQTIVGEKGNTLFGYKVGDRTLSDQLLDFYPDGRPKEKQFQAGDLYILSQSAKEDSDYITWENDHSEIIYKASSIKNILNILNINAPDNLIVEGSRTVLSPSIIFLIQSPAIISVEFNGKEYKEKDGIIFIPNASTGNYKLKVKGQENGQYTVYIGQISESKDVWSEILGEINKSPPVEETDTYNIYFNSQTPLDYPISPKNINSLFNLLLNELRIFNSALPNKNLNKTVNELRNAKKQYQMKNFKTAKRHLVVSHNYFFIAREKLLSQDRSSSNDFITKYENLYERSFHNKIKPDSKLKLEKIFQREKQKVSRLEKDLLKEKKQGKDVIEKANTLLLIKNDLILIKRSLRQYELHRAEILLKTIELLRKEIYKL